jgi:hypothetical protein
MAASIVTMQRLAARLHQPRPALSCATPIRPDPAWCFRKDGAQKEKGGIAAALSVID